MAQVALQDLQGLSRQRSTGEASGQEIGPKARRNSAEQKWS